MDFEYKNKLNIWSYKEYYRWFRIDLRVRLFFRKIKWMLQRAKYGYCDKDLWNLDYTLGNYIASSIEELANRTHGYPLALSEKEWDNILRTMSKNFYLGVNEEYWENSDNECWSIEEERAKFLSMENHRQKGFKLLDRWFRNLWD